MPAIFKHSLDAHEMSFAVSEVLAHVNYMLRQGTLAWASPEDGIVRVTAKAPSVTI